MLLVGQRGDEEVGRLHEAWLGGPCFVAAQLACGGFNERHEVIPFSPPVASSTSCSPSKTSLNQDMKASAGCEM